MFEKIKKVVFGMTIIATLGIFVTGCGKDKENEKTPVTENEKTPTSTETATDKAKKQIAINSASSIAFAAKVVYMESLLEDEPITSGNASDLQVSGTKASSGTWNVNTAGDVILKDVVIDDYICNTKEKEIECEKNN